MQGFQGGVQWDTDMLGHYKIVWVTGAQSR